MSRKWLFEVHPEGEQKNGFRIHLALVGPGASAGIDVVPICHSLDQFRLELANLKVELDKMLVAAEAQIKELGDARAGHESAELTPEAVWKKMQACATREELFDIFNALEANRRQETADYIFAHANMFKGWGPVFAEHYNLSSQQLEL